MLGDDSLACFLPRLSLETQKSSLKPEIVRPHPLGSHAPPGAARNVLGSGSTCLAFGERTGGMGYLVENPCRGQ